MSMYNKIFTKILDSSVWLEPTATRIVWITMIAAMDENGFCQFAAIGNVAGRARVSEEDAKRAIKALESPDPESSDDANEGRRIERVPGGWMVLNAPKYRAIVTRVNAQERTKERVRRFREKKQGVTVGNGHVTPTSGAVTPSETETEIETEAEAKPSPKPLPKKPDTVDARCVSESVGIFEMKQQADMYRLLAVHMKDSGRNVEDAMQHFMDRWTEYQAAIPMLSFNYGSSYKFFMSGNWDKPELWPRIGAKPTDREVRMKSWSVGDDDETA